MAVLHLLGTGAALSDPHRTTTMLAFEHGASVLVVDCGGDVVQRLGVAGLAPERIEAMVVTHEHPDHVSGFPLFLERIWLAGRRRPIPVVGIAPALAQARRAFEAFDTSGWEGMPAIDWREVAHEEGAPVPVGGPWTVTAAPGDHSVPVIGLRVSAPGTGTVAYSCDTAPCPPIARLARGADLLVHEATGGFGGHTTVEDAARIAREAGAGRLVLVHLPPGLTDASLAEARGIFPETSLGEEGGRHDF